MARPKSLVYGLGVNDVLQSVHYKQEGVRAVCPFYRKWSAMLERCYSSRIHAKQPTYIACSVCDDWLVFSNFKKWMEQQDWQGKELDKDILIAGNKVYSPDACVFVDKLLNGFLVDRGAMRGQWPIGVYFNTKDRKFQAQCRNPFSKKYEFLGQFNCPEKAHQAWRKRKHEHALKLADLQTDHRVAQAIRTRYL